MIFYAVFLTATFAAGATLCHVYDIGSQLPSGFATPWDVFANTLLMKVSCGTTADLSVYGTAATYTWKTAYTAVSGTPAWTPVALNGANKTADGNWIIGSASATLSTPSADLNRTNYVLAYVCTYKDEIWRCGCDSASACAPGRYSIQRFTSAEPSASPPIVACDANPMDVQLVLDESRSMRGQALIDAKAAANSFVDFVQGSNSRVGVTHFSDIAVLGAALSSNFSRAKEIISGLAVIAFTNIGDGVRIAREDIGKNGRTGVKHVIVLLTDGGANRPKGMPISPEEYAEQEATKAKTAGIIVYTIGLGMDINTASLKRMATTPSHYYFAPTGSDLRGIYDAIAVRECARPGKAVFGLKIFDRNGNGVRDADDTGLAGWTIALKDQNGAEKARAVTNASGAFLFSDVVPGNYSVCEFVGSAWRQTAPNGCHAITVGEQNIGGLIFLNTSQSQQPQFPTLTFAADAVTVAYNAETLLRWMAQNVTVCTASGAWSGSKLLSGIESTGTITESKTYTLTCTGERGSVTKSITITALPPPKDFSLAKQRDIEVLLSGAGAKTTNETIITVLPLYGFSGTVSLFGAPATIGGVTPVFNFSDTALSSSEYASGSRFSITFPALIPEGYYPVQVIGISDSLTRAISLTLKVTNFNPVITEE